MNDISYDDEDDLVETDEFDSDEEIIIDTRDHESSILDARRRLEKALEEKRLRDELDDFADY